MVAVPEPSRSSASVAITSAGRSDASAQRRRAVAVASSAMELFRPESDLARLLGSFHEVDLLLAVDDAPVAAAGPVRLLGPAGSLPFVLDDQDDDEDEHQGDVQTRAAALQLTDLQVHRLGLRYPLGPAAEDDMVAAMSELVGFDPEAGVYCLAPAASPADGSRTAACRAAQRIAQVYGIPLLRYRCLELSVVGEQSLNSPVGCRAFPG